VKIAYGNYGMPNMPYPAMLRAVAAIGYDGLELCVGPGYPTSPDQLNAAQRRDLRRRALDHGLEIDTLMAVGIPVYEPDQKAHELHLEQLRSIFSLAAALDLELPVLTSTLGGRIDDWTQARALLVDRVGDWAAVAAECGAIFAAEAHVGGLVHAPDRMLWLLEAVNLPSLKLNFDYSHFELIDIPLAQALDQLISYAVGVHVKDVRGRYPAFTFLLPGEGELDYAAYIRKMTSAGYEGYITVEISGQVFGAADYDPLAAAAFSYKTLSEALVAAGTVRG
jgi:sugar phosphate isomerase/epimerase